MPSSYSAAWSSSEHETISDDEKNVNDRRRSMRTDYETLERPSDCEMTDDDDEKSDRFSSTKNIPLQYLTRQRTIYENDWPGKMTKSSSTERISHRRTNDYDQGSFIDIQSDQTLYFNSPHYRSVSVNRSDESQSTMKSSQSKIPIRTPTKSSNQGAFRFFTADDRPVKTREPISQPVKQHCSPFTPINHRTGGASASAGNTPLRRSETVVDEPEDDDENEEIHLKEEELKLKLKQQKRVGRETGDLLNQLHENYNQLLEKYAQAENTIDQLRFQPKLLTENSPPTPAAQAVQGTIHFIQQPTINLPTVKSNRIYQSTSVTPISSSLPQRFSSTTTTTRKSPSPANSGTIESVFFDESVPEKISVQQLTTPETIKLDLLIQTKSLSEKMKSFLTLMDANQLSLAEQRQVYETIKEDYEKLVQAFERKRSGNDRSDIDLDADLNDELENMKQLLKEIVKRITDNLVGKNGTNDQSNGRLKRAGSQSSEISVRSSLCNHADLMDQYKKLLNAMNNELEQKKVRDHSPSAPLPIDTSHLQPFSHLPLDASHTPTGAPRSQQFSHSPIDAPRTQQFPQTPIKASRTQQFSQSSIENFDDETNVIQSSQFNDEHFSATSTQNVRPSSIVKKKLSRNSNDGENYDNLIKSKRKIRVERRPLNDEDEHEEFDEEILPPGQIRLSASSMRTRNSDYDSGFGTHNTTKLSRDSKLNGSAIDETHSQTFDEDHRHQSDDELMTSLSSSRSSASGATASSPQMISNKYTKRFNSSSSLKLHQRDTHRRKPSGHSDGYPSDVETHVTTPFDSPLPVTKRKTRLYPRSALQRSVTLASGEIPQVRTTISSKSKDMGRQYQTGFVQPLKSRRTYQSSVFIDEPHTHRRSQEGLDQKSSYEHLRISPVEKPIIYGNELFVDPQTGRIYRQQTDAKEIYQCGQCGSRTNFYHRHHLQSTSRSPSIQQRATPDIDDPGYESGQKRRRNKIRQRFIEQLSASETETDESPIAFDLTMLNEAVERAKKVQHRSQNLSRHINRQLKLVLATM